MPLSKIENITGNIWKGYWELTESAENLSELLLERDLPVQEGLEIKHPRRRAEWMAGRLLVSELLEAAGEDREPLQKDGYGKPYLQRCQWKPALTHRAPWVAGMLYHGEAAGIDLEKPDEKLQRLKHKFLDREELENAEDDLEKLCIYWAAKEALYKIYGRKGVIFSEQLKIEPFSPGPEGELTGHIRMPDAELTVPLFYHKLNELFLVHNL